VNWLGKDDFSLNFAKEKIVIARAAHFRIETSPKVAHLAVFKGEADVEGPAGKVVVDKKKTATFDATDDDKYTVADKIAEAPLDSWDREASTYHEQYAKNNSSPYGYGVSDLNYYGAYSNVPGYGMMWQPFFSGVGWDPFMDGAWSFYPGMGYMFASAYPWGWMPYRYGNWMMVPGMGWMWQPGGYGNWMTVPRFAGTLPANFHPLVAPVDTTGKTIAVGKSATPSGLYSSVLTVRSGSAGMGIARGSMENLGHLNREVAKNGSARVLAAPQFGGSSAIRTGVNVPLGMSSAPMAHSTPSGHAASGGRH